MQFIKLHWSAQRYIAQDVLQYWQLFCGTGKSDYRPLAAKANQQMIDTNVFNRVSLRWLLLVSVAVDISLRYFMDWGLKCLLV